MKNGIFRDWKAIIQIVISRRINIMPLLESNTVAKEEGETDPFTGITKKYIPNKTEYYLNSACVVFFPSAQ